MIRVAAVLVALAVPASAAAAPKVDVLVVGKTRTLRGPKAVALTAARVTVDGRRCRVGATTPLAALVHSGVKLSARDYGSCSKRPADAAGLYVESVEGEREKGRGGWVYKIGHRVPSTGGGDLASRLRGGDDVLWFWCRTGGDCQRTLAVAPARTAVAAGDSLPVTVTAYDDNGAGIPAAGATVRMGAATATAGADGVATLTVPAGAGTVGVVATKAKLVRSFPAKVRVG